METMQVLISVNNGQEEKQTFPAVLSNGTIQISINDLNKIIDILNVDPFKYQKYSVKTDQGCFIFRCETRRGNQISPGSLDPFLIQEARSIVTHNGTFTLPLGELTRMLSFPSIYNGKVTDLEGNIIVSMEWYKEDVEKRARWAEAAANKGKK